MTSTVAYPNPFEQWLWESGTIYWIYLLVGAPFVAAWLDRAKFADQAEQEQADSAWRAKAEAYRLCAEQLRLEIAAANERQPAPNATNHHE